MIDTKKLIPRSQSSKSMMIENLNVIKRDVIKIDELLKEKLVLSKVRSSILKRNEERARRLQRESLLEEKRGKKSKSSDFLSKRKKRGFLGGLFSGVLKLFGSGVFRIIPLFLTFVKKIGKIITPFTLISTGVLFSIGRVLDSVSNAANDARGVNKNDISGDKLRNSFNDFGNSLQSFALILVGNLLTQRAVNRALGRNMMTEAEVIDRLTLMGRQQRKMARGKVSFSGPPRTVEQYLEFQSRRRPSILGATSDMQDDLRDVIEKGSPEDKAKVTRMFLDLDEDTPPTAFSGGKSKGSAPVRMQRDRLTGDVLVGTPEIDAEEKILQDFLRRERRSKTKEKQLTIDDINFEFDDPKVAADINIEEQRMRSRSGEGMSGTGRRGTQNVAKGRRGTPSYRIERPDGTVTFRSGGLTTGDILKNEKIRNKKIQAPSIPKKLVGKKGVDKLIFKSKKGFKNYMSNIGLLKPLKKFFKNSIGMIPFLGDIIGLLLDVFIFGEPLGRAAFMAGGGLLGGFLGVMAGSLLGPAGGVVGGILGGIAGDLIGGVFYDLIFRRQTRFGQQIGKSMTKKGLTKGALYTGGFAGYGTYMLGEGGREFVLDADSTAALERKSPGFLMALNKARGAEAIGVIEDYASYDKTSTGRERMMPIPIPIPQKDSSTQQIIMTDSEAGGGTGGGFITFLSEHYRRA